MVGGKRARPASALSQLWRLLDARERRSLVALQLLSIVTAFTTVAGIAAIVPFFTVLADPGSVRRNVALHSLTALLPLSSGRGLIIALGLGFAAAVLLSNAIGLCGLLAITRFALRAGDALRVRLFDEYLHRDYAFHCRHGGSALATRILNDAARVTSGILQQGLLLVTNAVTIAFILATMVALDPGVAAAALIGLGASYAGIYSIARGRLLRNGQLESRWHAERARTVDEALAAIKEVTVSQASGALVRAFAAQCRVLSGSTFSTFGIAQSPRYALECTTACCLIGVALYYHGTAHDAAWLGPLGFVGLAAYRLLPALQQVFSAMARMRADHPALAAVVADLRRGPSTLESRPPVEARCEWRGRPRRELRLHEVTFRYPDEDTAAVAGVTLSIAAGAMVGLVGPNGSGKTTLVDLVSGLLAPHSGWIEVDGVRLDERNRAAWQTTIAYVPQHSVLLDASVTANIAFGVESALVDHERVRAAARVAGLDECLDALPGGYDCVLGVRGRRLSGGQRQRLALARALYRGASLLILDEATSALDLAAEADVIEALSALEPRPTIILVAHRPSALRLCEVVHELDRGAVVRSGELAADDRATLDPFRNAELHGVSKPRQRVATAAPRIEHAHAGTQAEARDRRPELPFGERIENLQLP